MNRLFLYCAILTLILLSSCRKDFTCSCSQIYKNNTSDNIRDYSHQTYRDTRNDAETKCKANISSGKDDTGNYSMNCQIDC